MMNQENEHVDTLQTETVSPASFSNFDNGQTQTQKIPNDVSYTQTTRSNKILIVLLLAIITCVTVIFSRSYTSVSKDFQLGMSYEEALKGAEKNYADSYFTWSDDDVDYIVLSMNDFWEIENTDAVSNLFFDSNGELFGISTNFPNDSMSYEEFNSLVLERFSALYGDYETSYGNTKIYYAVEDHDLIYLLTYDTYENSYNCMICNTDVLNEL